jgi:hypothetical protein
LKHRRRRDPALADISCLSRNPCRVILMTREKTPKVAMKTALAISPAGSLHGSILAVVQESMRGRRKGKISHR